MHGSWIQRTLALWLSAAPGVQGRRHQDTMSACEWIPGRPKLHVCECVCE